MTQSHNEYDPNAQAPTEERQGERRTSHLIRRGVPIAILLVGLVGAWIYWSRTDHAPAAQAVPGAGAGPLQVSTLVVQLPILGLADAIGMRVFAWSIGVSAFFIYALTLACGLYPSLFATRIEPVRALRYE